MSITLFKCKCNYCKKEIVAPKEQLEQKYHKHLDNCEVYKSYITKLEELDKKGILQGCMKVLRLEQLEKDLEKIMKKYKASQEELIKALEDME